MLKVWEDVRFGNLSFLKNDEKVKHGFEETGPTGMAFRGSKEEQNHRRVQAKFKLGAGGLPLETSEKHQMDFGRKEGNLMWEFMVCRIIKPPVEERKARVGRVYNGFLAYVGVPLFTSESKRPSYK